jgi:hypothetical protein
MSLMMSRSSWRASCGRVLLGFSVVSAVPSAASAQAAGASGSQASVEAVLGELRKLVLEQRAMIDGQAARLGALERDLAALRGVAAPPAAAVAPQVEPASGTHRQPEMPRAVVSAGDFPGSIRIPGTDSAIKFGGQARMTLVQTLGPLGTDDRFVTSSIPVGDQQAGEEARTVYSPSASRFGIDLRTPFPRRQQTVRTFIEGDFAGTKNTFRLRHAYIQTNRWVIGQTWSTFSDPEAEPIGIDFEGLNAISLFRQPQIRYSFPLREGVRLALALENPAPDLTGASGVNLTPDLIARVRWEPKSGVVGPLRLGATEHVQASIIGRQLRGELPDQPSATLSTGGVGFNLSGVLMPRWSKDDRVKFATNNGWGIGKYITDLGTLGGQDAVYDPLTGQLRALPVSSGYVGYERAWRPGLVSAFTYGIVNVSNLDIQPEDALKRTQRTTFNLTWSPVPQADVAVEFLYGTRVNKDGAKGTSSQLQAGWIYRF